MINKISLFILALSFSPLSISATKTPPEIIELWEKIEENRENARQEEIAAQEKRANAAHAEKFSKILRMDAKNARQNDRAGLGGLSNNCTWLASLSFLGDPGHRVVPTDQDMVYLSKGVHYVMLKIKRRLGAQPFPFGRYTEHRRLMALAELAMHLRGELPDGYKMTEAWSIS